MTEKSMLFLGAGASVPAGLPTAKALTDELRQRVQSSKDQDWAAFLSLIIDAWDQAPDPKTGERITAGYENWMATLRSLVYLSNEPLWPIINAWNPEIQCFLNSKHSKFADPLLEGNIVPFGSKEWAILDQTDLEFMRLLKQKLWFSESTEYHTEALSPLRGLVPSREPLTIATINYDNTIEKFSSIYNLLCDHGFESWLTKKTFEFDQNANIKLLKLHGSFDWREALPSGRKFSHIVAGAHEKYRFDGPFPAIFQTFRAELWKTDRLIVVGYSFGDEHINHTLLHWLVSDMNRKMVIIDTQPFAARQRFRETYASPSERPPKEIQIHAEKVEDGKTWEKVASVW